MKDSYITLNVKEAIKVPFLPTSRSRKKLETWLPVVIPVKVRILEDDKDFPVAFRVTDYSNTINNITKEEFIKDYCNGSYWNYDNAKVKAAEDNSFKTEDIRFYNGKCYKAVHINLHGTLNSSLYESKPDFIQEDLSLRHTVYTNEKYNPKVSVTSILENSAAENIKQAEVQKKADSYVMFENKVWKECGEPFYSIDYFGVLGEPYLHTEYSKKDLFDETRHSHFSALHKEECLDVYKGDYLPYSPEALKNNKEASELVEVYGTPTKPEDIEHNIEVLMPECVKIKDFIDIEYEKQKDLRSQLSFIADKVIENTSEKVELPLIKIFEAGMRGILDSGITKNPYFAYKKLTENWSQDKKDKLNLSFKELGLKDKSDYDNYFSKTFGCRLQNKSEPSKTVRKGTVERDGR